jgi:hypothetical protein
MKPPHGPSQKLIDEELEVCEPGSSGIYRVFQKCGHNLEEYFGYRM